MTVQPKYHWQFTERESIVVQDSLRGLKGQFHRVSWKGHGRIGQAIQLDGKDSHIKFGNVLGKFGTNDFTVAFGIKILNVHGQNQSDIIGSRNIDGHGNWFALFLQNQGKVLAFAIDEDRKGKHFTEAKTKVLSHLPNKKWHHIAIVREGKTLKIYLDGAIVATATSKTGVANITNSADVRLGHYTEHTSTAQYEDLRVFYSALTQEEIQSLIPPYNPPLKEGEIELVGADDASIILTRDVDNLSSYSTNFQALRLGHNTGVTLYKQSDFEDTAQQCYANLPDIRESRLNAYPQSVRIWSTVGEPFTGKWVIKAPNGQYLSIAQSYLSTTPLRTITELFRLHHNVQQSRLQLIPGVDHESSAIKVSPELGASPLYVDMSDTLTGEFSIMSQTYNQWLELRPDDRFIWTSNKSDRALFIRAAKFADNEGQVGELAPGEVALYENVAYHGKTWVLANPKAAESGNFNHFSDFQGLNDQTSSIRLGPDTGVTLFRNSDFHVADGNGEKEIEDIVNDVPNLSESQIGDDALSSIKIFRTIDPTEIFSSYTSQLSQDYRMVGDKLEEFSAYRTILRLEPDAGDIEVSATDLTTIEVDGENHEIDEQRSVTLTPNEIHRIMITSEADGIDTPGLKFRTQSMAPNERVVIFPNQDVHQQIAELEDDALWNATDTQGNLIVDQKAHSKEEVASVQNTVTRMMGTVAYENNEPTEEKRSEANSHSKQVRSSTRTVSGATIENHPWELQLGSANSSSQVRALKSGEVLVQAKSTAPNVTSAGIEEREMSQDEFMQLLSQSTRGIQTAPPSKNKGFGTTNLVVSRGLFSGIKNAIKKATSIVVGVVKGAVHLLVKTVEGVVDFVVDTVKKVVEVIEAVVETVVKAIKKFIEFLQFLFNWDDILEAQRYLVGSINAGFDYVAQQVEAVKAPVSDFMDGLQDTVEKGMNQLITTLGGEPSEVRESGFELPEAVEWFLSKLLGGSKRDNADTVPKSETQPNGDSKLESFMFHFFEACEDAAGAVLRGFEGLGETIATLVANPLKPQLALIVLIETFRDVTIQMLEAIENFALGFLDVIVEAVEQIQKMLNAEIKIPFISNLFELIGAGKLTLLNLTGLLLAIPVTVVAKIVLGETPFKNEPLPDFSTPTHASLIAESTGARLVAEPTGAQLGAERTNTTDSKRSVRIWGIIGLTADTLNGVINAILDLSPETEGGVEGILEETAGFGFEILSLVLDGFSWLASFPSSPGFPGGRPYNLLAHKVSDDDKPEKQERVMWGWRTFMYWLDVALLANKGRAIAKGDEAKLQRLKRAEPKTIGFFCVASILDAAHAIQYLAAVPKKDKSGFEIANEVVSWLPNILAPLRITGFKGAVALTVLDAVATTVNTGLGSKLLHDDLAEL